MPQTVETARIASRNVSATVVALTGSTRAVEKRDSDYNREGDRELEDAVGDGGSHCAILRYRTVAFRAPVEENKLVPKTPEEWLAITAPPEKTKGSLKLFLGYAPGVGKTYSMLSEAIRRHSRGEDVVIGVVETHGRKGIAELCRSWKWSRERRSTTRARSSRKWTSTRSSRASPRSCWSTSWPTQIFPAASTASATKTCWKSWTRKSTCFRP